MVIAFRDWINIDLEISEAEYNEDNLRESKQDLNSDKPDEKVLSGQGKWLYVVGAGLLWRQCS